MLSARERALRARLAAHALHSQRDSRELTAAARAAFFAKLERQVDPDGVLAPEERRRRAEHARRAHLTRAAYLSARKRSAARRRRAREAAGRAVPEEDDGPRQQPDSALSEGTAAD